MNKQQSEKPSTGDNAQRMQWTEEQRIQAGHEAARSLNSPILNVVHDLLMQRYFRLWQIEDQSDKWQRETLWYKQNALKDVLLEMSSMVTEAQEIVAAKQAVNDPAEQERRRLDEQGYGLNYGQGGVS